MSKDFFKKSRDEEMGGIKALPDLGPAILKGYSKVGVASLHCQNAGR